MNTATKLGAFVLGLGVVFAAAYGAGHLAGPGAAAAADHDDAPAGGHTGAHDAPPTRDDAARLPGGLLVSDRGYTLSPVTAPAGQYAFRITGPDGRPVTGFDLAHDKRMHLIAARRDLSGFRHVHPQMDADGTWRVASPVTEPGSWRVFADFTPNGGPALTLGLDTHVPGDFRPRPLPAPAASVSVDGYTVRLRGALEPGRTSELTFTVSRDGVPVTDLRPYLGAYGHLVALREGDLAYLHVHPNGTPGDGATRPGPDVTFSAEVPSAGRYRLFLDFQNAGTVHTAAFTAVAGGAATPPAASGTPAPLHGEPGHGHN